MMLTIRGQADPEEIAQVVQLLDAGGLIYALLILTVAWFANRVLSQAVESLSQGHARRRLRLQQIASFARLGLFVGAGYLAVIALLGDNETALLGLGTTLAVAVGFALKDTVSSVMAGVLILIDRPIQVGDRVTFEGTYGDVAEIGLRSVRIVTRDDNLVSIPNNKFLTESVSSGNAGSLDMMVELHFHIAAPDDFDLAKRIVYEATVASKYTYLQKGVRIRIRDEITGVGMTTVVRSKAYVIDLKYEGRYVSDVTERVKRAFKKYRIRYPYMREFSVRHEEYVEYPTDRPAYFNAPVTKQVED